jgi:hypothetical protein
MQVIFTFILCAHLIPVLVGAFVLSLALTKVLKITNYRLWIFFILANLMGFIWAYINIKVNIFDSYLETILLILSVCLSGVGVTYLNKLIPDKSLLRRLVVIWINSVYLGLVFSCIDRLVSDLNLGREINLEEIWLGELGFIILFSPLFTPLGALFYGMVYFLKRRTEKLIIK